MTDIRIDALSRFTKTEMVVKDGIDTFGLWTRPEFLKKENLQEKDIITLSIDQKFAGRPDLIADVYYKTPLLEWIVIMFNRPLNTMGWPKAGTVIQIPSPIAVSRGF